MGVEGQVCGAVLLEEGRGGGRWDLDVGKSGTYRVRACSPENTPSLHVLALQKAQ